MDPKYSTNLRQIRKFADFADPQSRGAAEQEDLAQAQRLAQWIPQWIPQRISLLRVYSVHDDAHWGTVISHALNAAKLEGVEGGVLPTGPPHTVSPLPMTSSRNLK